MPFLTALPQHTPTGALLLLIFFLSFFFLIFHPASTMPLACAASPAGLLRQLKLLEQCSALAPVALSVLVFGGPNAERPAFAATEQLISHACACADRLSSSLRDFPAAWPAAAVASGALQRMVARAVASLAPADPASQQLASRLVCKVATLASGNLAFHTVGSVGCGQGGGGVY